MKKYLYLIGVILGINFNTLAQSKNVGIGTFSPNDKAILEISSQTKGLLIPRLDQTGKNSIQGLSAADAGLLIYYKDDHSFNFWNGTGWEKIEKNFALSMGTNWVTGYGNPTTTNPSTNDGSFYLDNISGKVYIKQQGTWGATTVNLTGNPERINKVEYGTYPLPSAVTIPANDASGAGHYSITVKGSGRLNLGLQDGDMAFVTFNADLPTPLYVASTNVYIDNRGIENIEIIIMNNSSQVQTIPKGFQFNIGIIKQ